jgi:cytochrome c oxidase subunit I
VFIWNIYVSVRARVPAGPNPWQAHTLEWATSSPPPRFNFNLTHPVPKVRSYAPLLDVREQGQVPRREPVEEADGAGGAAERRRGA